MKSHHLRFFFVITFLFPEPHNITPQLVLSKLNSYFAVSTLITCRQLSSSGEVVRLHCLLALDEGLSKNTSIRQIREVFPEFFTGDLIIEGTRTPEHYFNFINTIIDNPKLICRFYPNKPNYLNKDKK